MFCQRHYNTHAKSFKIEFAGYYNYALNEYYLYFVNGDSMEEMR